MRNVVCDSSSLISLSDNCLLWLLPQLSAEFLVPEGVKVEIVDAPAKTKKFELKAMRLAAAIKKGSIKVLIDKKVVERGSEILRLANSLFKYGKHTVKILHRGEAETLALVERETYDTLLIDERTTRLLVEDLGALKSYIQARTGFTLHMNKNLANELRNHFNEVNVIRSSELIAYAYDKGLFEAWGKDTTVLHAALYGVKYSGCAITSQEIEDYMRMLT